MEQRKPEKKKRKALRVVLIVLAVLVLGLGAALLFALPQPVAVGDLHPDLAALADGTYTGHCDNGIVAAAVEVEVRDGAITAIRLTEHRNGLGQPAAAVLDGILTGQNLDVDAVAGATYSSQTILKAVENALYAKP